MESVVSDPAGQEAIFGCFGTFPLNDQAECSWGSPDAPLKIVIVGDSIASGYAVPLREIAKKSGGQIDVYTLALGGCQFAADLLFTPDEERLNACPARKQAAVDFINATKPSVVVITNTYKKKRVDGSTQDMTPQQWEDSVRQLVDQFRASTQKVVFLSPPPFSPVISECFGRRGSAPRHCAGQVDSQWMTMARTEQELAQSVGGVWVDSRPWFCSTSGNCPIFAGSTPTKFDEAHMVPAYGVKIHPVILETFQQAGIL
jgi:hypothetical protein